MMWGIPKRIFVHQDPVDLRKGFEGLSFLANTCFSEELTSGALFVFLNKQRNRMKVLYWDTNGFAIWCKRLEKGAFMKLTQVEMNKTEFFLFLEGIIPKQIQKHHKI